MSADQIGVVERYLALLFDPATTSAQLGDLLHEDGATAALCLRRSRPDAG